MNNGKTITELASALETRASLKHDVVTDASNITMHLDDSDNLSLHVEGDSDYQINDVAHRQISTVTGVPHGYYERMRASDNAMVAGNVNHWLNQSKKRHMVRTMGDTARAMLSDRYLRIDNENIASGVLPVLYDIKNTVPLGTEITDKKMYLKFLFEGLEADITGKGDTVKAGVLITNSEVGHGQFMVKGFFYRDFCLNGCVFGSRDMGLEFARKHLGSKMDVGVQQVFSNETIQKNHDAIVSASADILKYISSPDTFQTLVTKLRATREGEQINPSHVPQAVEVLGKQYGLSQEDRGTMLGNLIGDGDFSRWGVLNSITKVANDKDFDHAHDLENIGGKIIDLTQAQWNRTVESVNELALVA